MGDFASNSFFRIALSIGYYNDSNGFHQSFHGVDSSSMAPLKLGIFVLISSFLANTGFSNIWEDGDVLLLPLNCYSCRYIENETGAPYSHSGVLLKINNQWAVAQSLGKVKTFSVSEFLSMGRKGAKALHLRSKFLGSSKKMVSTYLKKYKGLAFDSSYRWDNFDEEGRELLYCSEFISKFLNQFLTKKIKPKAMDYSSNWEYWFNYFNGDVPQGEPGNSPADFFFSADFTHLRKIQL